MLYTSYIFIFIFLPIVLAGYYTFNHLKRYKTATIWLCVASLFFYGYFNWSYLIIILSSILGNYLLSHWIRPKETETENHVSDFLRRLYLIIGLLGNLGALFYFKYFDFFINNLNGIFGTDFRLLYLLLPLGISFFTFQQISYLLDCYHGKVPRYSLSEYALFVIFFLN